jgi:hypothetical protein
MAWESFQSRDGIYAVDWQGVGRIIRSYVRSCATLANAKVNEEFHWIGPTLHTVDVNWDQVRMQTDSDSEWRLADVYQAMKCNTPSQIARLVQWVELTKVNNGRFHKMMQDAQKQTMENIDKSVGRAEVGLKVSRALRDASAEFLMVSATIVSGGSAAAAAAALGGITVGAGLKATAKGQDDANATKKTIAVTFVSEFAVGLLDLGAGKVIGGAAEKAGEAAFLKGIGGEGARQLEKRAAERGTEMGLAILWNQLKGVAVEPTKAVIEGEHFQNGLVTGQLKSVGGTHGEVVKYLIKSLVLDDPKFKQVAAISDATIDTAISLGADALAKSLTEKSEKREGAGQGQQPKIVKPTTNSHALLDALAYDRQMVEKMALRKVGSAGPLYTPSWSHVRSSSGFNH